VLEAGTVELVREVGLGARMAREGHPRITVRRSRGRGGHVSSSILRNLPAKQ
jgi:hypothetical protein